MMESVLKQVQLYAILDKSMIGWITHSNYDNGCYEQAEKIARISLIMITSLGTVMLPRVANLFSINEIKTAKEYIYKSYRFVWLVCIPMMIGIIVVSDIFIPLFLGSGYDDAIRLLNIFSFLVLFVSVANITGNSWLIPTKQQNVYTASVSIAALVNLAMNIVLIKKYGAYGAAIASVSAELLGASFQLFFCIRSGQLSFNLIFRSIWRYILAGTVMMVVLLFVKPFILKNIIGLIILVVSGVIVYVLTLLCLKDDFIISIIKKYLHN